MKAILMKPKLNAAFKLVQPLPVLTDVLPVKLHYAAAPRFDVTWPTTEITRHPTRSVALPLVENNTAERSRRLSAVSALAGVMGSCAAMTDLTPLANVSQALEARRMA